MNITASVIRKLHLGSFDQLYDGWVNTDVSPHIFISRITGLPLTPYSACMDEWIKSTKAEVTIRLEALQQSSAVPHKSSFVAS